MAPVRGNGRIYLVDLKSYMDFVDGKVYPIHFAGQGVLLQHATTGVLLLPDQHGGVDVQNGHEYRLVSLGTASDYQ